MNASRPVIDAKWALVGFDCTIQFSLVPYVDASATHGLAAAREQCVGRLEAHGTHARVFYIHAPCGCCCGHVGIIAMLLKDGKNVMHTRFASTARRQRPHARTVVLAVVSVIITVAIMVILLKVGGKAWKAGKQLSKPPCTDVHFAAVPCLLCLLCWLS